MIDLFEDNTNLNRSNNDYLNAEYSKKELYNFLSQVSENDLNCKLVLEAIKDNLDLEKLLNLSQNEDSSKYVFLVFKTYLTELNNKTIEDLVSNFCRFNTTFEAIYKNLFMFIETFNIKPLEVILEKILENPFISDDKKMILKIFFQSFLLPQKELNLNTEPEILDNEYETKKNLTLTKPNFIKELFNNDKGIKNEIKLLSKNFDEVIPYDFKYFKVKKGNLWGLLDSENKKLIIPIEYESISFICGICITAKKDNFWGIIDFNNNILLTFVYEEARYFCKEFILIKKNNLYGVVDSLSGKLVIDTNYNEIDTYFDRYLFFRKNELGEHLNDLNVSNLDFNKYIPVKKEDYWGLIDTFSWKEFISPKYEDISLLYSDDWFPIVKKNGFWIFLDKKGNELVNYQYLSIKNLKNDLFIVKKGRYFGVFDLNKEKEVISPEYDERISYNENFPFSDHVIVRKNNLYCFINVDNWEIIINPKYEELIFNGNNIIVSINKKFGVIRRNTLKEILPVIFDKINIFKHGDLICVEKDNLFGLYDKDGKEIVSVYFDKIEDLENGYIKLYRKNLCGLIDKSGKEILPLQYESIMVSQKINENQKVTNLILKKNGLWGIIKENGEEIIPFKYDKIFGFNDNGISLFQKGKYWGLINNKVQEIVSAKFNNIIILENDLFKIQKGKYWGIIDKTGNEIIHPEYNYIGNYSFGIFRVRKDKLWGFIDSNGKEITPLIYDDIHDFIDDYARVKKNGLWGFIDKTGKEIISPNYDVFWGFKEGLSGVKKDKLWGFIDTKGKEVIPPKYALINEYYNGFGKAKRGTHLTIIDKTGKEVIPFKYDYIGYFYGNNEITEVRKGKYWGIIDKTGKEIAPLIYHKFCIIDNGFAILEKNGLLGVIDKTGKKVIPFKYSKITIYDCGVIRVQKFGLFGLVDFQGKEITPIEYSEIYNFFGGYAEVRKGRYCGIINKDGKETIPLIYNKIIYNFNNGYALARKDIKIYMLDINNNEIYVEDINNFANIEKKYFEMIEQVS